MQACRQGDIHSVTLSGVNRPVNNYSTSNTSGWTVFRHHKTNEGLFAHEFFFSFPCQRLIRCLRIHLIKQHGTLAIKCHVQLRWEERPILLPRDAFASIFLSSLPAFAMVKILLIDHNKMPFEKYRVELPLIWKDSLCSIFHCRRQNPLTGQNQQWVCVTYSPHHVYGWMKVSNKKCPPKVCTHSQTGVTSALGDLSAVCGVLMSIYDSWTGCVGSTPNKLQYGKRNAIFFFLSPMDVHWIRSINM